MARSKRETITGTITKLFHADNGFAAGRIKTTDGEAVHFSLQFDGIRVGDHIKLTGRWENHPKFGDQFKATAFAFDENLDARGIEKYIANHPEIKGIGPGRAKRITEYCAAEGRTFDDMITNNADALAVIAGLSFPMIEILRTVWMKGKEYNACATQLAAYELTHKQIGVLLTKYGGGAARMVRDNPYRLIDDIDGYGFKKADRVARKAGVTKELPERIRAGIKYEIDQALQNGDCFIHWDDMVGRSNRLLVMDCIDSRDRIENEIENADKVCVIEHEDQRLVALRQIYEMESEIAGAFRDHGQRGDSLTTIAVPDDLTDDQVRAVSLAVASRISVITGGAGTGKTYAIAAIVDSCAERNLNVALCAPTGKAAKRMEQATGRKAHTIHRLLGWTPTGFTYCEANKLTCEMLIVDEVSMLDVPLCWHLFQAIDFERTALVLVGDHNQLPPVGPGNILRDLVRQRIVPVAKLGTVVRQAGLLKRACQEILVGHVNPAKVEGVWHVADMPSLRDAEYAQAFVLRIYETALDSYDFDIVRDVQLLTPIHKGALGTDAFNRGLQRIIQKKVYGVAVPEKPDVVESEMKKKGRNVWVKPTYYVGDRVIQNKNDYETNVMNGTVGIVESVDAGGAGDLVVNFDGESKEMDRKATRNLSLAYASTVHKMQGSECECVVVIAHRAHSFMSHRNLLYTAATRAKRMVVLVGDRWGMKHAAKTVCAEKRRTFLGLGA